VDYVQESCNRKTDAVVYLFCDYQVSETQRDVEILSSINRQLVQQLLALPEAVKSFRDRFLKQNRSPTADEHAALTETISKGFSKVFVIIDALDECAEKYRTGVLLVIKRLARFTRVLLTSRPNLHLDQEFDNLACLCIEAHGEDVESYVRSELQTHYRLRKFVEDDAQLELEIITQIQEKAAGM
jgi:hypothetical protein